MRRFKGTTSENGLGSGQAAWKALEAKADGVSNTGRQASCDKLTTTKTIPGQGPDELLYALDGARDRMHEIGEHVIPERYGDIILKDETSDYWSVCP